MLQCIIKMILEQVVDECQDMRARLFGTQMSLGLDIPREYVCMYVYVHIHVVVDECQDMRARLFGTQMSLGLDIPREYLFINVCMCVYVHIHLVVD